MIDFPAAMMQAQTLLHRERLPEADKLLIELEQFVAQLVAMDDQVPGEMLLPVRVGIIGMRADWLSRQMRFSEAKQLLQGAAETAGDDPATRLIVWSQLATLEMRTGATEDTKTFLATIREDAERLGDLGIWADATTNLAILEADGGKVDTAVTLLNNALRAYQARGYADQAADCIHMLGALARDSGLKDDDSIQLLEKSLNVALEAQSWAAVGARAGDLARTYLCRFDDGDQGALEQARGAIEHVRAARAEVWRHADGLTDPIGARIARARDDFNNLEIEIHISQRSKDMLSVFGIPALAKGKILRSQTLQRIMSALQDYPGATQTDWSSPETVDEFVLGCIPVALEFMERRTGRKAAIIDHFAFAADKLLWSILTLEDGRACLRVDLSTWSHESVELQVRGMFGEHQGAQAKDALRRVCKAMEDFSGPAPFFFDAVTGHAGDSEKDGMRAEWGETRQGLLRALGEWFFPHALHEVLMSSGVEHILLSPDPRFFSTPWNALILPNGATVIDEPWTLSLLPTVTTIFEIVRRRFEKLDLKTAIFAPDKQLNEGRGGNDEIARVRHFRPEADTYVEELATLAALNGAWRTHGWVHLRAHGATGDDGLYVPKLFDGRWISTPAVEVAGPAIVSACCRSGETQAGGQDIFGMVDIVERGDGRCLVAPVVSVEGVATVFWMNELYQSYEDRKDLGVATREASRVMRERLPHPAFWGAFVLVGDPLGGFFGSRPEGGTLTGWSNLRAVPGDVPPWLDTHMAHHAGWTVVVAWDAVDEEWTAYGRRGIFLSMIDFVRAGRTDCETIHAERGQPTKELAFNRLKAEVEP